MGANENKDNNSQPEYAKEGENARAQLGRMGRHVKRELL